MPNNKFYFLDFKESIKLFDILKKNQIEARFVGGCVRDAILGIKTDDFDIAVNCDILKVCDILEAHEIKCIKTGIKYGSITVFVDHLKFELTTLRKDEKCFGRQCEISKISSFQEDASRRDFTINALYVSIDGELFDYFNGIDDLKNKKVSFIGDPSKRISEDYLRIFRYYRFCAKLGDLSDSYHNVIKNESKNICKLSIERIQKEIFKILESSNSFEILKLMKNSNVVENINLIDYEKISKIKEDISLSVKLYILFTYNELIKKFHLPKILKNKIKGYKKFENESLIYNAYKNGFEFASELYLIKNKMMPKKNFKNLKFPEFPVEFKDLPQDIKFAGKKLKACEKWWVENNFQKSKEECLKYLAIIDEF